MGVITLMGSGEISPTMVKVHRQILERQPGSPAVFVDTPYGFQANADEITAKVSDYFATSLNTELQIASLRSAVRASAAETERMLETVRGAGYLFSGPGSPSYALRNWHAIDFGRTVQTVLAGGGSLTLASAAAVTAGLMSVPVYEIYKVGEDPRWLKGLDVLSAIGLKAAVIPHFDNAEGGTHDTRYCYLGQERFDLLRRELDADTIVVGVDEHTALILDTDELTARVVGRGAGHFVLGDEHRRVTEETPTAIDDLLPKRIERAALAPRSTERPTRTDFEKALAAGDADLAIEAVLAKEASADGDRSELRGMIVRLGDSARSGLVDPRTVVGGYVEALLELRGRARADQRWDEADFIRAQLAELGVTVTDTADSVEWELD